MPKQYLFTFRPADYYFFGTEKTFANSADGKSNYLVKTNLLPQQTAIVGLIRHAMFDKYDIGQSFGSSDWKSFGCLNSISPLFMVKTEANGQQSFWLKAPMNFDEGFRPIKVDLGPQNKIETFDGQGWKNVPKLDKYDPKEGLSSMWFNPETGKLIAEESIFKKGFQTGIDKAKRIATQDDKDAFYKQEYCSLNEGFRFGVFVEMDEKVDTSKLPTLLPFGGEKRSFVLDFQLNGNQTFKGMTSKMRAFGNQNGIVLTADTYVENADELSELLEYAISTVKPFRHIVTPKDTKNFGQLKRTHDPKGKSDYSASAEIKYKTGLRHLLAAGSVLFPKEGKEPKILELLTNASFSNIGYNHFI